MEYEIWLLWATLAVSLLFYLTNQRRRCSGAAWRLPPGPRPLPVIGNLLDLRGTLHHTLAALARGHGPVMRLQLGLTAAVVVSSRDAAREAFANHDRRLAGRDVPDATRALGFCDRSMTALPSSDQRWKNMRGIVATHIFSPRCLAAVSGVRERKVRDLVVHLSARAGQEVDVGEAVYGGVLNLMSSAFMSVDVGTDLAREFQGLVEDLIKMLSKPNISDLFPFLRPLDLQGWRRWAAVRYERAFRILDGIVDRRLAEASSSEGKHGDFLDALLDLVPTGKISRDDVTSILFDVFGVGSDTMAVTVVWAMAELLRNPGVMDRVRTEMERALGGKGAVEESDAAGLPYLQAVLKESMRLHPVAPLMVPHCAMEDGVEIGGYAVPKGCKVIFNTWAIMRDPAAWERPDDFVPERFLGRAPEADFRGKEPEFIPFGAGRRLCPGLPMVERVVPFILASLLHAFEWRLPDGVPAERLDVSERFTTVNVLAVPLKAVPVVVRSPR